MAACTTVELLPEPTDEDFTQRIAPRYLNTYHAPNHYVIVASFASKAAATRFIQNLQEQGYNPVQVAADGRFRVSLGVFSSRQEAIDMRNTYKNRHPDKSAWIWEGNQ